MKAVFYTRYGAPDVLEIRDVPAPRPKDDEVLIRVRASTVSSADARIRALNIPRGFGAISRLVFGVTRPRQPILGSELAGVVEAAGAAVTSFAPGDEVFGSTGAALGAHAEQVCMRASAALAPKPRNLTCEEAAPLSFGGTAALEYLRRTRVAPGEAVLINGASGAVGSAAVQLAKHLGAVVTGVCSAGNAELVRSLGADHVIDYAREDFAHGGARYDVILDVAGTAPFRRARRALKDGGRLGLVLADLPAMLHGAWASLTSGKKVSSGPAIERAEDLRLLAGLAEAGVYRPVIDRRVPFEQIADAHRWVDSGRKRGSVVITFP